MASEWETISLDSLIELDRGISYGIVQPGAPVADGVPIVRVGDVRQGRVAVSDPLRVAPAIEAAHSRTRLVGGELLLTLVGTVGEAAIAPASLAGWNTARAVAVIPVREDIGAYWVKLALKAPGVREIIDSRLNTTVQATLNLKDVAKLPIVLPPITERKAIAHILGTLDDKIELNRRMSETLEAIARALFKSWFMDFEPGRVKAEGHDPGLPREIADLFPSRLVDSEIGDIPQGWEVIPLQRLTVYLNRGLSPKYIDDDGVLVLNQKCVRGGRVDASKGRRHDPSQRKVDDRFLKIGDVLVNSTGVGTLGRIAQILSIQEPTIVDSHVTIVRADPEKVSWNYLGIDLQGREGEMEALGEGSTGQTELSRARLGSLSVLLPPRPLCDHFDKAVLGLRLRAIHADEENEALASLRDSLLPKLLSGELRVRDAEKFVERAA